MRGPVTFRVGAIGFVVVIKNPNWVLPIGARHHVEAIPIAALAEFVDEVVSFIKRMVAFAEKLQAQIFGSQPHFFPAFLLLIIGEDHHRKDHGDAKPPRLRWNYRWFMSYALPSKIDLFALPARIFMACTRSARCRHAPGSSCVRLRAV